MKYKLIVVSEDEIEAINKAAIYAENWAGLLGNPIPGILRNIRNRWNDCPTQTEDNLIDPPYPQ